MDNLGKSICLFVFISFFLEIFDQFPFDFFFNAIKGDGFVDCFFQDFGLRLYISILLPNFFLNHFHMCAHMVNIVDSLLGTRIRYIVENFDYF